MDMREQYAASLAAYRDGIAISHAAGLARREAQYEISASGEHLRLGQPAESLAALERAGRFLATHNEPGLERTRLHDQTIALLALGRIVEAQAKLRETLARYDRETGPNARINVLRDLAPALARAGDRAGALDLYMREQVLLQAKNDSRYDRDMQDVQKLIKAEGDKLQARRAVEWGGAAAVVVALALAIAFVARRQAARNRQLESHNDQLMMQVEHDPLTGLANRATCRPAWRAGRRAVRGRAVPDRRRLVQGHQRPARPRGRDSVLVEIARRLEACCATRPGGALGRRGVPGDGGPDARRPRPTRSPSAS